MDFLERMVQSQQQTNETLLRLVSQMSDARGTHANVHDNANARARSRTGARQPTAPRLDEYQDDDEDGEDREDGAEAERPCVLLGGGGGSTIKTRGGGEVADVAAKTAIAAKVVRRYLATA